MKFRMAVISILFAAGAAYAADDAALKTQREKVSYGIGMDIGNSLKKQSIDVDTDLLMKGLKDAYTGGTQLMTEQELRDAMTIFRNEMMAKQTAQLKELSEKNKKEGEDFLAENKKKEGVVTLPSGLQYKIITEGTGEKPKATDTVSVHYIGTLVNGTEFDNSHKHSHGDPVTFPVSGVIPGWVEALQLMKTGSKWQLFIPANLAYGEKGAGRDISPNSALIFEVELISIESAKDAASEGK
ncbi:MAG: FKBP-type peptidyl-prolyl cis-trans isomerase [Nitrospirae bacterium]|nr:FKBP-type peptidyl-prolyl cis-trans isomerase [Nitrospirota bacterium]